MTSTSRGVDDANVQRQQKKQDKANVLRDIPSSDRFFWKAEHADQWNLTVTDKSADGTQRVLLKNEVTVMALNEVACHAGRGFFFHMRNKEFWKKPFNPALCPDERAPVRPG